MTFYQKKQRVFDIYESLSYFPIALLLKFILSQRFPQFQLSPLGVVVVHQNAVNILAASYNQNTHLPSLGLLHYQLNMQTYILKKMLVKLFVQFGKVCHFGRRLVTQSHNTPALLFSSRLLFPPCTETWNSFHICNHELYTTVAFVSQ